MKEMLVDVRQFNGVKKLHFCTVRILLVCKSHFDIRPSFNFYSFRYADVLDICSFLKYKIVTENALECHNLTS